MPSTYKPGSRYHFVLLLVPLLLIPWRLGHGQDTATVNQTSTTAPLPDSQPELERLRMQTDDRLTEAKQSLKSWDSIVTALTSAQNALPGISAPPASAFQGLSDAVKARELSSMRSRLTAVMSGVQSMYDSATSFTYSNAFYSPSARSGPDPELQTFLGTWRTKVDAVFFKLNVTTYFNGASWYSNQSAQTTIPPDDLETLKQATSPDALRQLKMDVSQTFDALLKEATSKRDQAKQAVSENTTRLDEVNKKLGKTKLEINQLAIELGLPLFCGTVLLMLIVPIVLQARGIGAPGQIDAIFASGILVEIITVLLLTMSILILGLSGKIEGPVLGTLLGGISGYVLNRFRDKKGDDSDYQLVRTPRATPTPENKGAGETGVAGGGPEKNPYTYGGRFTE